MDKRYRPLLKPVRLLGALLLTFIFAFQLNAQQTSPPFSLDLNLGGGLIGNPDVKTAFQPEVGLRFQPGRWGVGLESGFFSFDPAFDANEYRSGFEQYTVVEESADKWNAFYINAGPRFRFGNRLPVQFNAGFDLALSYKNPPVQSVKFNDPEGNFAETPLTLANFEPDEEYSKWTAAIRPQLQLEFSPFRSNRIGFNLKTGIQHELSDREFTYTERNLERVQSVDSPFEMFFQFENAPEVERTVSAPKTNFFANVGVKINFGGSKAPQTEPPLFTENETQDPPGEEDPTAGEEEDPGQDGEAEEEGNDPPENEEEGDEEEEEDQEEPDQLFVGENGEFEVENLTINGNGPFSGTGEVFVDWLQSYISVEFTGITVNPANNHLTSGQVTSVIDANAPAYPKAWASPLATNYVAYNHPEVASVHNYMLQQPFYEYNGSPITPTVLEAPIGVELDPDSWFSIMEIVFESDKSKLNASVAYETPADWNNADLVGFSVKDIEFHPLSISFQQGRLEIVDDLTVGNANNDINFTFISPDGNNVGTFIEWDEYGFNLFGIEMESEFTRDWLLPVPDNGTDKVTATLSGTGYYWNNHILSGDLEKAEFVDGAGMSIEASSLNYDMSHDLNPIGIEFPENYAGQDTTVLWRGFYAKNFTIGLPESIETNAGGPPEVGVQDMIIDHQGATLTAFANNVYQYPNASVADLNVSVDTVNVKIETNTFTEAYITGQVAIPATHPDSLQSPLNYTGLFVTGFSTPNGSTFEMTVDPSGPIYTNMLKGTLTLEPSSVITASVGNGEKSFDMALNGDINWGNVDLDPITNINMGLEFAGLGFDYQSNSGLNFAMGSWSLASPQKFMHNFPVSFQDIQYIPLNPGPGELLKGKIGFTTVFNLSENLGGQTTMGVGFVIDDDSANFKKFAPQYDGLTVDEVVVNANLNAVNINGLLYFDNDDPIYGKRVGGSVQAEFTGAGLNIEADAQFGNTSYQNGGQLYRYWQVDVQADFPDPGVPFLTGVAFRGFGGGAYNNMEVDVSPTGERSFTPLNNMFGFNAGATIATTPEEQGFNADVTLMGEFSTNGGGMTYVGFNGDFGTGASIQDRRSGKGKVFGNLLVEYVFPTKNFTFAANANINTDPVKTIPGEPFNLTFNIDGMANEWSFKAGVPTNTNDVEVLGVNLYEYLMLGNSIPNPNGFTNRFASNYAQHFGYSPNNAHMQGQVDNNMAELGAGFAMGLGFEFEASGSKQVYSGAWRDWSIGYEAAAGAELHLSFLEYASCSGFNEWGINGWRAGGGFGFYASVSAWAQGYHRNNEEVDKYQNLATLKAGGYITGKFPKPVYASGAVTGSATVLNVFDVNFHQQFQYGTNCSGGPVQPNVYVTPGDAAGDFDGALVNYVVPQAYYNFPLESPLSVKYGLIPDEQFSVPETQANGTIEMRTFKLEKTVTLEKSDNSGNYQAESLNSSINNLGEYQYVIAGPISAAPVALAPSLVGVQSGGNSPPGQQQMAQTWNPNPAGGGGTIPQYQQAPAQLVGGSVSNNNPPNYGNLPPESPPPVNDLDADTWYKFTVDAVLMELVNGNWMPATDNSGNPITQTEVKNFYTGDPGPLQPSSPGAVTY
ncbi:hypothetical protein [Rhodohalobacter sp.]|uniref:hypothetical protein n=1 Tax=Rhodohalobacter sp. TaxID=1974210 RepID=UPI0035613094